MKVIHFFRLSLAIWAAGISVTSCQDIENQPNNEGDTSKATPLRYFVVATDSVKDLQGGTSIRIFDNLSVSGQKNVVVYDSTETTPNSIYVRSGLALVNYDSSNKRVHAGVYRKGGGVLRGNGMWSFDVSGNAPVLIDKLTTDGYGNLSYLTDGTGILSNLGKPEVYRISNTGDKAVVNINFTEHHLVNGAAPNMTTQVPFNDGMAMSLHYNDRDSAVIAFAKLDKVNNKINIDKLIATDKAGKSRTNRKGSVYGHMALAGNGDLYYFGGTATHDQRYAAVRIKKGTTEFDKDYLFDLNTISKNRIVRVQPIGGEKFLVQFFEKEGAEGVVGVGGAGGFAILDMNSKTAIRLPNIPAHAAYYYGTAAAAGNYVYIPVSGVTGLVGRVAPDTPAQQPTIYAVDIHTGATTVFMTLKAGSIIKGMGIIQ